MDVAPPAAKLKGWTNEKEEEQRERRAAGFMTRESGRVKNVDAPPLIPPPPLQYFFCSSQMTRISTFWKGEMVSTTRRPLTARYAREQSRIFPIFLH